MKKIICLALVFAMLFSGCSKWKVEIVDPTKPSESEAETSSEQKESEDEKIVIEHEEKVVDYILWGDGLSFNTGIEDLYSFGITYGVDNIKVIDDWYWSADLVLKKDEKELTIPIEGMYYCSEEYDRVVTSYGGFTVFEDYIVYTGKEKAMFFDSETLEAWSFVPELEKHGMDDIYVNSAVFDEEDEKFYLLTTILNKYDTTRRGMVANVFDKNGKMISEKQTEKEYLGGYADCDYVFPEFTRNTNLVKIGDEPFIFFGSAALINMYTGGYYSSWDEGSYSDGKFRIDLKTFNEGDKTGGFIVYLYENDVLSDWFVFEENNLSIYYEEIDKPTVKISSDGKTASYYSDYFAMTLELDFENKTHSIRYEPEDRHISKDVEKTKSSDGKYSICHFGEMGGGDAYYSHLAVKNNETGEYSYLGKTGGMYGGNGGYGFLKNGDAYIYSVTELKILDSSAGNIKFDITKNFPLGFSSDGEQGRGLLTFRRDPNDFSYIVVYYEFENGYRWKTSEREGFNSCDEASFNYKIGFLDPEGNLTESYDTGLSVLADSFGYHNIEMRYSKEKLTLFFTERKADRYVEGVFDMETKEFTLTEPK